MSNPPDKLNFATLQEWLEQNCPAIVERVVTRARQELSDYRNRDLQELTTAAERAYITWYKTILQKDFAISQNNSRLAVQNNLTARINPDQVTRTPWLIYEAVLEMLEKAPGNTNAQERAAFVKEAHKVTQRIVTMAQLEIANKLVERATNTFKNETS